MPSQESTDQATELELFSATVAGSVPSVSDYVNQAIVDRSLASVSVSLVKAMEDCLEDFKECFALSSMDSLEHPSKRLKIEAKQIIKTGNQQQFANSVKVLEKFESMFDVFTQNKIDKAKDAIKECNKLYPMKNKADKSKFGWQQGGQACL